MDATRRYVAFDIETAKVLPELVTDLMDYRPLGIACAAAIVSGEEDPIVWYGANGDSPAAQMSQEEVRSLVGQFCAWADEGYTLLSWNGLGFDFNILAEESGLAEECARIAIDHVDMMFHIVCELGFPVSLGKAAEGLGLPGKAGGISGCDAPVMWSQGRWHEVIEYNIQDSRLALAIALEAERQGELRWLTRRGTIGRMPLRRGWRSVREALATPEPDTSWMSDPPSRRDFTTWIPLELLA